MPLERTYLIVANERGAEAYEVEVGDESAFDKIGESRTVKLRSDPWRASQLALERAMPEEKW